MNEIFFIVKNALEGGYTAKALGESIYTVRTILKNSTPTSRTQFAAISMKTKSQR